MANRRFPYRNIVLAHTTDAGSHWSWVDTGIEGNMGVGFHYQQGDLSFLDGQHGWATGGLGIVCPHQRRRQVGKTGAIVRLVHLSHPVLWRIVREHPRGLDRGRRAVPHSRRGNPLGAARLRHGV